MGVPVPLWWCWCCCCCLSYGCGCARFIWRPLSLIGLSPRWTWSLMLLGTLHCPHRLPTGIRLFNAAALDAQEKINLAQAEVAEGAIATVVRSGGQSSSSSSSSSSVSSSPSSLPSYPCRPRPRRLVSFFRPQSQHSGRTLQVQAQSMPTRSPISCRFHRPASQHSGSASSSSVRGLALGRTAPCIQCSFHHFIHAALS